MSKSVECSRRWAKRKSGELPPIVWGTLEDALKEAGLDNDEVRQVRN